MTLLAEAKVQGSRYERPGLRPETDGRLEQNLAYSLPATKLEMPPPGGIVILHRGTPLDTETSSVRRLLVGLIVGSFVAELLLAEVGLRLTRGTNLSGLLGDSHNLPPTLASGVGLALVVAVASRFYFATFARQIVQDFFVPIFRSVNNREVAMLAILPAIGEEALFRGMLQPLIGIIATSFVFGFLHTGFSRRLLPYSAWTVSVGFLLGALYLWTGNLWGSIVAHALINTSGVLWTRSWRSPPPSGRSPQSPSPSGRG